MKFAFAAALIASVASVNVKLTVYEVNTPVTTPNIKLTPVVKHTPVVDKADGSTDTMSTKNNEIESSVAAIKAENIKKNGSTDLMTPISHGTTFPVLPGTHIPAK